jgi:hypothetical protein
MDLSLFDPRRFERGAGAAAHRVDAE